MGNNEELCKSYQSGDSLALEKLLKLNQGRLVGWCKNWLAPYSMTDCTIEDCTQEAIIGMIKAAKQWDSGGGQSFLAYAKPLSRREVIRSILTGGLMISIPVSMEKIAILAKNYQKLYDEYWLDALLEGIDAGVDDSIGLQEEFAILDAACRRVSYYTEKMEERFTGIEESPVEQEVIEVYRREAVSKVLDTMTCRQRKVLELCYGINKDRAYSLREVAQMMGLSATRVGQIKNKAMRQIREFSKSEIY